MIEPELLERLRSIKLRVGLSEAEQIRRGVRSWLESREWPVKRPQHDVAPTAGEPSAAGQSRAHRRAQKS
jgi:hypothetical protein